METLKSRWSQLGPDGAYTRRHRCLRSSRLPPSLPSFLPLLTRLYVHSPLARFTTHVTTPVELAVAALHQLPLERVVASATAHEGTAVHTLRVSVTLAAHRAQRPRLRVGLAIVRGPVQVNEVLLAGLVVAAVLAL